MGNDERLVADGAGGNGTGPADGPPTADAMEEEGTPPISEAEEFATYDDNLDFSAESLETLDKITRDVDMDEREELPPHLGAYLGAVFVRSYDGEWVYYDATGWVVAVEGDDDEELVLTIPKVLEDCLEGDDTFAGVHNGFVDALGVEGPTLDEEAAQEDGSETAG